MYAINHAATALLLKKKEPSAGIWLLLISVQLIEILWVLFNYLHIEHYVISGGRLHLDYLPYSHSIFSTVLLAIVAYCLLRIGHTNKKVALVFAIGVISHVVLDALFHEQDIRLSPFSPTPVYGLGIIDHPWLNFILEMSYGIFCWAIFRGSRSLLVVIVIFNLLDLPIMLASGSALDTFINYPFLLPTFILFQIVITWYFVAKYSKTKMVR